MRIFNPALIVAAVLQDAHGFAARLAHADEASALNGGERGKGNLGGI
jgi:hypothetical protein